MTLFCASIPALPGLPIAPETASAAEVRSEPRTNMFVMATIYAGHASAPVKIRDLSTKGALVEGAQIPPLTTKINLRRGSLDIAGEVVWCRDGRAGLRFDAPASVAHWLPGGETLFRQEQIDAIFQEAKTSADLRSYIIEPDPSAPTDEEIRKVIGLIEALAEDLANDSAVIARHGQKLQSLDLAAQLIGKLARGN